LDPFFILEVNKEYGSTTYLTNDGCVSETRTEQEVSSWHTARRKAGGFHRTPFDEALFKVWHQVIYDWDYSNGKSDQKVSQSTGSFM
jgi:hypothetical protein